VKKPKQMLPTPFLIRVLHVVKTRFDGGKFTTPSYIAGEVFPEDHPGWRRSCKCGAYGSTKGSGLVMMMGGYLGKLKRGETPLVCSWWKDSTQIHCLTTDGDKMLRDNIAMLEVPTPEATP
jgi:hypothetical protein